MVNLNLPWRPDEDGHLNELWCDPKLTAANIGALLGRPRNSVIGRVNRLRAKEGADRWPMRPSHPPKEPKVRKLPPPSKPIKPILPDRVTVGYTDRCFWTECGRHKERGNYCKAHAEIMYVPRRA